MFEKSIAALKAVEEAIKVELEALWVPFDPVTGSGGAPWHGAAAGALQETFGAVTQVRTKLESQEPPAPAPEPAPEEAPAEAPPSDAPPAEAPTEAPTDVPAEVPAEEPVNPSPVLDPAVTAPTVSSSWGVNVNA